MDPNTLKILQGAAGAAGSDPIGVEDVFKTYVYKGNGGANTINNGIDLSGTGGGLVWLKNRDRGTSGSHMLFDTERGSTKFLQSDTDSDELTSSSGYGINTFNSNGFTLQGNGYGSNRDTEKLVSYTFKKQEKFFDVVTWTGDSNTNQTISHGLKSIPGCIFAKRTDSSGDWTVYHRGAASNIQNNSLKLNSNAAANNDNNWQEITSTSFRAYDDINVENGTFVAYLFAHEEAEFGPNSDQKIISCGSYTGNGSGTGPEINLGFQPQWIMIKRATGGTENWAILDTMRGWTNGAADTWLRANTSGTGETGADGRANLISTGFKINSSNAEFNASGDTYVYIAIAAETGKTMKAIETGTDVFAMDAGNSSSTIPAFDSGFPVDFSIYKDIDSQADWQAGSRLQGGKYLYTSATDSESNSSAWDNWDSNEGFFAASWASSDKQAWMFKRHAGFDLVTYEANQQVRDVPHSLGKVPEMIWIKSRNTGFNWKVYHKGANGGTTPEQYYFRLNHSDAEATSSTMWNNTAPTSTVFTIGTEGGVNNSGSTYIAMLFASVDGVSKVGYYDGSSSTITVTTGFQPRFVIIKRATGVGQWSVFDTTRGWGSGNDQKLELSDSAAQANNYDAGAPTSTGFTVTSGQSAINNNGDKYIYYAHA